MGPQDPVVRQTSVEGTAFLTAGKPVVLGSLDIPGSTRHLDVDVMMEVVNRSGRVRPGACNGQRWWDLNANSGEI